LTCVNNTDYRLAFTVTHTLWLHNRLTKMRNACTLHVRKLIEKWSASKYTSKSGNSCQIRITIKILACLTHALYHRYEIRPHCSRTTQRNVRCWKEFSLSNGNIELFICLLISISPTGEKGGQGEIWQGPGSPDEPPLSSNHFVCRSVSLYASFLE